MGTISSSGLLFRFLVWHRASTPYPESEKKLCERDWGPVLSKTGFGKCTKIIIFLVFYQNHCDGLLFTTDKKTLNDISKTPLVLTALRSETYRQYGEIIRYRKTTRLINVFRFEGSYHTKRCAEDYLRGYFYGTLVIFAIT